MDKIELVFGEKVGLVNYDEDKDCMNELLPIPGAMYLVKAKEMYFLAEKSLSITAGAPTLTSHKELAAIFELEGQLEQAPSVEKQGGDDKQDMLDLALAGPPMLTKIKNSVLFPKMMTCTKCRKLTSEFTSLSWNYSLLCF